MAGLIQDQMAPQQQPMPEQGMPPQEAMPAEDPMAAGMEEEEDDEALADESDPAFQSAIKMAMQALYEAKAAKGVAESLKAAPDPVQGLADTAYEMTSIVDERTDGSVPDELIVPLGMAILGEVVEIGTAAGVQYQPADIAQAFKTMLLRFLGEQGMDTTQLQQAMDQVDPQEFNKMAAAEEA